MGRAAAARWQTRDHRDRRTLLRARHPNSADLTTTQKQRLTALEVLGMHVFEQCNHVVHIYFIVHGLEYIASYPGKSNMEVLTEAAARSNRD